MRSDPSRESDYIADQQWGQHDIELFSFIDRPGGKKEFKSTPFSGNERNRLFMMNGDKYDELTLVSGSDFRQDTRGFVLFDYDNDGWMDMGVFGPNFPRFRVLRNCLGDRPDQKNSFVEVELQGGQSSTKSTTKWSARDAYGAQILVTTGSSKRAFQLSASEGLSSQNTKRVHIGMGKTSKIDSIEVTWPSGKKTIQSDIAAGSRIKILEVDSK